MNLEQLKGRKVAILGLGMEGVALANFLSDQTEDIALLDKLSQSELGERAKAENDVELTNILNNNKFQFEFGPEYLDKLDKYDLIFRSPGVPYLNPKIQEAKERGIIVSSQIKLFFDLCPCPIIGVTGTKGKGTTSSLIELMMKKSQITNHKSQTNSKLQIASSAIAGEAIPNSKKRVYLAGNIGEPAITLIDKLTSNDVVILELSSFQLQDLEKSPHIAVVLNISSDHLDYHKDENEYKNAKLNIVKFQSKSDFAVINQDYLTSYQFATETEANIYYFSNKESIDQGAYIRKIQNPKSKIQTKSKIQNPNSEDNIYEVVLRMNDQEEIICRSDEIQLIGKHNLENIAAAGVAASICGADIDSISNAAKSFAGLPHRLESVKEINGIKFYNDSYATNPAPTMAAIDSFSQPIHLILGGSSKGADFNQLAEKITQSNIKSVFLIGDEKEKIDLTLKENNYAGIVKFGDNDFQKIALNILEIAKSGDVVLLSPACASFGLFNNYKDRGEKFKEAVNNYKS